MTRAAAFALLFLFGPLSVRAQVESRFDPGSRLFGAGVFFQKDAVHEFSNKICPGSELGVELGGGILALKWLAASAFGRVHAEILADECLNGLIPPPPDSGIVVFTDYSGVEGYPYLSTGLRLTAFSGAPHGGAFRAYAGGEWLWGKSIIAPFAGFGLSIPVRRVLILAEAERSFLSIPYERVEVTYQQRRPIAEQREEHSRKARRWGLRLGLELAVPRR